MEIKKGQYWLFETKSEPIGSLIIKIISTSNDAVKFKIIGCNDYSFKGMVIETNNLLNKKWIISHFKRISQDQARLYML